MRRTYLFSLLLLCGCAGAEPSAESSVMQEVTVANRFRREPACVVRLPRTQAVCSVKGCSMPPPKGSTLKSIELTFICVPKLAPPGFDNPQDYAKVLPLRARNSFGDMSMIDDIEGEPGERMRQLDFCLYGNEANFCGGAKVLRLIDGEKVDATVEIKAFIESIELRDGTR